LPVAPHIGIYLFRLAPVYVMWRPMHARTVFSITARAGDRVVGEEMRRFSMGGMRVGRVVHLVQHPSHRVVGVLADIETQASRIARDRLAGVVQEARARIPRASRSES
jgi:hypothetical protein